MSQVLSSSIVLGDVRLFLLQSEHILLGSNFSSDLMVAWFFAARSAAGFGGRLDMAFCLSCTYGLDRFQRCQRYPTVREELVGREREGGVEIGY